MTPVTIEERVVSVCSFFFWGAEGAGGDRKITSNKAEHLFEVSTKPKLSQQT